MAAKKLQVVPGSEFVELVSERLDGTSKAEVGRILKAMTAEVADCISKGYAVNVGTLVKIEPRYKKGLPKAKRFSPFDGETKMRPAKPEGVNVKARVLAGAKRDIPTNPKTKAFQELVKKLPKPKAAPKKK
jgi:hypothetical protein